VRQPNLQPASRATFYFKKIATFNNRLFTFVINRSCFEWYVVLLIPDEALAEQVSLMPGDLGAFPCAHLSNVACYFNLPKLILK
jgi:hypothetical protein